MSYVLWVVILLAALALIPFLNPSLFAGLPIWVVVVLAVAAVYAMRKGNGVDS